MYPTTPKEPEQVTLAFGATADEIASVKPIDTQSLLARRGKKSSSKNGKPDEPGRFMRRPEVERATGLSRSSLYRLIADNDFPPPVHLTVNAVAWLESEVKIWISDRIASSRNGSSPTRAVKPSA